MKKGQGNINVTRRKACRTGSKISVATCYDLDANGKRIIPAEEVVVVIANTANITVVGAKRAEQTPEQAYVIVKKGTLIVV